MISSLLEVRDLKVRFHTGVSVVEAVVGASFSVAKGEVLAIVGESGSGKSASMLACLGVLPRQAEIAGSVVFKGQDLRRAKPTELREIRGNRISMVFQDPMTSLNPVLSIERQITETIRAHQKVSMAQARGRAVELLEAVGIPGARERLGAYPHQFSGGMRQRVMIAIALACDPDLLIADEPTTALDVTVQAQILDLVRQLQSESEMAIVWISHDLGLVASLADRVAVMYAGSVVEEGTVDQIFDDPRHPYTLGLLAAIPRLDTPRGQLTAISGVPPDMSRVPPGCAFYDRCQYRVTRCIQEMPPLRELASSHRSACWVDPRGSTELQP